MTAINLVATLLVSIAFGSSAAFGQEYELVYVGSNQTLFNCGMELILHSNCRYYLMTLD